VRPDHLLPPIPGRVGFEARLGPAYPTSLLFYDGV